MLRGFDRLLRGRVLSGRARRQCRRVIACALGLSRPGAALFEREKLRFAPALEQRAFGLELVAAGAQHLGLLGIEGDLLLPAVDLQLPGVRGIAHARRCSLCFSQLDAQSAQLVFDLSQPRVGRGFVLACGGQSCARRLDQLRQPAVSARKQHLFPAAHLVAQPPVAPRLGRLPLERPALLFDFVHDVIDAREVLLGRLELQFGGAPAGLVFGDARRFLDQLTPVGRSRTENQPDLALLDNRVGFGAEAGVHQQFVDVPETARMSVNQVLAFARTVQPPGDLDLADRLHHLGDVMAVAVAISVAVALGMVAIAVRGLVHVVREFGGTRQRGRRNPDAAESQPDLGRPGWLSGIGAVEDDVLHLLAPQALGALFAHDPSKRIGDVALAAPVGADDRRHALIKGELRAI